MIQCAAESTAVVAWSATLGGATATGVCASGYTGTTTRVCSSAGIWLQPAGACTRTTRARARVGEEGGSWARVGSGKV